MGIKDRTANIPKKEANSLSSTEIKYKGQKDYIQIKPEQKATNNLNAPNKDNRDIGENEYNAKIITSQPPNPQGGFSFQDLKDSVIKAYMPEFLYRPPFGYPRKDNIYQLDMLAKNPYVFAVNKAIQEEVANMSWDIVKKEDYIDKESVDGEADTDEHNQSEADPEARQFLVDFLNNPNVNSDSFSDLIKMAINDIVRYDAGVWIKVFDMKGNLKEIYARKGGSFLKNTTIFGTMHERADIVLPLSMFWKNLQAGMTQQNLTERGVVQQYHSVYSERAAYFQYGQNYQTFPIPFGRREIAYMTMNPQSDSIYGISPLQMLYDTILTLIYGGKYNLDFYSQNNMPEGIVSLQGADPDEVQRYKAQFENNVREKDDFGIMRKRFFKMLFSSTPAEFIPFNMKPADMQILEQQKYFHRLVMMCFGMSENELGVVEDVNRANGQVQYKITNRRAILPYLRKIENVINNQILTEFSFAKGWEFKFSLYDMEEDFRKHELYEKQINMGIKTANMVAEEEGIDIEKLEKSKQKALETQQETFGSYGNTESSTGNTGGTSSGEDEQEMPEDNTQDSNFQSKSRQDNNKEIEVKEKDKYDPPESARNNAKKVLKWKEEHGDEVAGMTETGWRRARQLASGEKISFDIVKRMAQFNRHRDNSKIAEEHKDEPWKDNGYVAWMGWGGDSGINWAIKQTEKKEEKKSIDTKSRKRNTRDFNPIIDAVERSYEYIDEKLSQLDQDMEL